MKRITQRRQCTLAQPAVVRGIGYLTGKMVTLRFVPAPASTGVVFVRSDLGPQTRIPARTAEVTGTQRRTTLGQAPVCVGLVEHVLAALAGLHIDNCIVEVDAPEPPGLDGSALEFVLALQGAGTVVQGETIASWSVSRPVVIGHDGATVALYPSDRPGLRISYLLNYGALSPIHPQRYTCELNPASFTVQVAPSRTFLLEHEAKALLAQGLGKNTRVTDLLVFGPQGPMANQLRFGNEPARHKTLDILGDLSLLGQPVCGHLVAYRSGHELNLQLVRALDRQMMGACERVSCGMKKMAA